MQPVCGPSTAWSNSSTGCEPQGSQSALPLEVRWTECSTASAIPAWTKYFAGRAFSADQVARGKPAPDLVLHAAHELGVAPEDCAVVEDSPHGILGAVAAGMRAIGFVGGSHMEGIRERQAERLRDAGADVVVTNTWKLYDAICAPVESTPSRDGRGVESASERSARPVR